MAQGNTDSCTVTPTQRLDFQAHLGKSGFRLRGGRGGGGGSIEPPKTRGGGWEKGPIDSTIIHLL